MAFRSWWTTNTLKSCLPGSRRHRRESSEKIAAQAKTKWSIGLYQLPGRNVPSSPLSFTLSLLFCVFCPIYRGRWWPGCRQPWQMAVCVCVHAFVFVFYSFIPQRSLSQAQSIQRRCLTTTFNPMGPTGLGCEVSDWSKEASLIFMHQTHKASQREVFEKCIIIPPH